LDRETSGISAQTAALRAQALLALRRYEEALAVASAALASDPSDYHLLCLSSLAQLRLDRADDAIATAQRAIASEPLVDWAHRLHALALLKRVRPRPGRARRREAQQAVRAAEEAVRCAPQHYLTYVVVCDCKVAALDVAGADEAARTAISLAPDRAESWVARSSVALLAGDHRAAEQAARAALARDPENHAAHNNLGVALLRRHKRSDAAGAFYEAGRLQPTNATVHRNLLLTGSVGPRLLIIVIALPLLLIPNAGPSLYFIAVIVANVALRRFGRLRHWATSRGARLGSASSARLGEDASIAPAAVVDAVQLKPLRGRGHVGIRTPLLVIADVTAVLLTALLVAGLISPGDSSRTALIPVVLVFIAFDAVLGVATWRRLQARRTRRD
jgi:tetratricopeptide (TPR) repeat protein